MNKQIIAYSNPEIKTTGRSQESETGRSHSQKSEKISQIGVTVRSPRDGRPVPCDRCGGIFLDGDYCKQCRARRLNSGFEALGSILGRLFEGEARSEHQQLELFTSPQKPQISSIPGVSPKIRNRYRVTVGERILASNLTISEALEIAGGGES